MCQFLSSIVLRNGDILHNWWTDSHEDLIRLFKLRDNKQDAFARIEFRPENPEDLGDPARYTLRIDEAIEPEWFDEDRKIKVAEKLRGWIKGIIIEGDADLLCGGVYILKKGARVATVQHSLIKVMLGDANVGVMRGSSNVGVMRESSKVGEMRGSSNVGVMWESSNVGVMWGSSNVGVMWGSSNVGEMWESSKVGEMWESSKVGEMWESSKVQKDERENTKKEEV